MNFIGHEIDIHFFKGKQKWFKASKVLGIAVTAVHVVPCGLRQSPLAAPGETNVNRPDHLDHMATVW